MPNRECYEFTAKALSEGEYVCVDEPSVYGNVPRVDSKVSSEVVAELSQLDIDTELEKHVHDVNALFHKTYQSNELHQNDALLKQAQERLCEMQARLNASMKKF